MWTYEYKLRQTETQHLLIHQLYQVLNTLEVRPLAFYYLNTRSRQSLYAATAENFEFYYFFLV